MNTLSIDQMIGKITGEPDLRMVEMLIVVHDQLPCLPEHFECADLYDPDQWEDMDKGERISKGQALSWFSHQPWSPIRQDGFTTTRHNRYRRK